MKESWLRTALGSAFVASCSRLLAALLVAPILAGRLAGLAASHDNGVA